MNRPAKRLRIVVNESDKHQHTPLYEALTDAAFRARVRGVTVTRGIMGYGPDRHLHTEKVLDLSSDLPIIVELVDTPHAVEAFVPVVRTLLAEAGADGLVTLETVDRL